jgi:hypothetical protein
MYTNTRICGLSITEIECVDHPHTAVGRCGEGASCQSEPKVASSFDISDCAGTVPLVLSQCLEVPSHDPSHCRSSEAANTCKPRLTRCHAGSHRQPARGPAAYRSALCLPCRHALPPAPTFHSYRKLPASSWPHYHRCHPDHLLLHQPLVFVPTRPFKMASYRKRLVPA